MNNNIDLKSIFLFKDLDNSFLKKIEKHSSVIKLKKGNILFYEGDESKNLHLLLKGVIKLYKSGNGDKELFLKYFQSHELIAEVANFEEIAYPATAEAMNECEVLVIDFFALKEFMFEDANFSYKIITSLVKKVKNLEGIIATNLIYDTTQKVAKYLYEHSEDFFNTKNVLIAQILNIKPETLSRTLKKFKDLNLLDIEKKSIDTKALKLLFS